MAPEACAHGFAVALPLAGAMARPTGIELTRTHSGKSIPIEGADESEVATMISA